jgi:hypothetical protein
MLTNKYLLKILDESDIEDLYKMNQEIFKEEIVYDKYYLNTNDSTIRNNIYYFLYKYIYISF